MAMIDEDECPVTACKAGLPGWVATFADLMSLLMCFFVLLLSFSEMDVMKFKRLAGSMAESFGVQNKLKVNEIPKGTSIIAQEFSPGRPEPTPINEIWQKTDDFTQMSLEVNCAEEFEVAQGTDAQEAGVQQTSKEDIEAAAEAEAQAAAAEAQTEQDAIEIAQAMQKQISEGKVEVEVSGRTITIRIREKGSFSSGSATLKDEFYRVLTDIRDMLLDKDGLIAVEGHTDNIPINTAKFRSNWALSAARAVAVTHVLLRGSVLNPGRFEVKGHGDTVPIAPNDTPENRSLNRRVEIVIQQGKDKKKSKLKDLRVMDDEYYDSINVKDTYNFELEKEEIF